MDLARKSIIIDLSGTPGRARTDTGTLLGGLPLPLGYGGAEIVPHVRRFIQRYYGNGQLPIVDTRVDLSR